MKIFALPFKYYRYNIYPKIRDRRGATRFLSWLEQLSQVGMDKVSKSECEGIFELGDWDNLVIIDACRFDLFKDAFPQKDFERRYTLGSSSAEFIEKNFTGSDYSDIDYITANPHFHKSHFKYLTGRTADELFNSVYHTYMTDWDDRGTVLPESVKRDALTAQKLFPDNRRIIHFMQPHHPFVGSDIVIDENGFDQYLDPGKDIQDNFKGVWSKADLEKVDNDKVWKAYRENLEFVMSHVEDLVKELDGTTVVTADHANLFGENGLYGHPKGLDAKGLKEVPLLRFEK